MSLDFTKGTLVVGAVSETEVFQRLNEEKTELPCDIVELRLDALSESKRHLPLHTPCPKPLLLTLRHQSEGGACEWDEQTRLRLAEDLLPAAAALDWEIARLPKAKELLKKANAADVPVIASAHYFDSMPSVEEMHELEQRARDAGAAVVKIAFTPNSEHDVQRALKFLEACRMPAAIMGMGKLGAMSRKLYTAHGSALLYGYLGDKPTAPGQLSAKECLKLRKEAIGSCC